MAKKTIPITVDASKTVDQLESIAERLNNALAEVMLAQEDLKHLMLLGVPLLEEEED